MATKTTRISIQLVLVIGAWVLAGAAAKPALWAFVASYGVLWLVFNLVARKTSGFEIPLSRGAVAATLVTLTIVSGLSLWEKKTDLAWNEGLHGQGQHFADRRRIEKLPSIAPPILFADHPQTFYVHAPEARRVSWRLGEPSGEKGPVLEGESLGQGLFRILYDPRRQGLPLGGMAVLVSSLEVDGRSHPREVFNVRPQAHPRWFASAPELGQAATVSEETDELFLLSRQGLERRQGTEDGPTAVVFVDQGRVLAVAHRYSRELLFFATATGERLAAVSLGPFQTHLAVDPSGRILAVAMGGLKPRIDLVSWDARSVVGTIPLQEEVDGLLFGRSSDEIVVASRSSKTLALWHRSVEANTEGEAVEEGEAIEEGEATDETGVGAEAGTWIRAEILKLGRPAVTMARGIGGREIFVATTDYRPDGMAHRGNHFIQDQILTVDLVSWQVTEQRLTARRTPDQREAGNVDSGISPMGMVAREDGSLLVAFAGSDEVWEVSGTPSLRRPPRVLAAGSGLDLIAPHGVADLGEGYWAASSPAGGCMAIYSPVGELLEFIGVAPADDELLASPDGSLDRQALLLRSGERAFYEGTRAGISCQSCHLHGGSDESPHDIGQEPLLPTLTVRGVTATSPYLRDGSFPRIRDLDQHLAGGLYRGYERYDERRGLALEAYVERLPRPVNPRLLAPSTSSLEVLRHGTEAFVAARCALCHSFPAFTNLSQHPVRSLFPEYGADLKPINRLDTPSLLGSHRRDHFLQDGRAHSLQEVMIEHNPSNRHGDTRSLSDSQRSALEEWLLSL